MKRSFLLLLVLSLVPSGAQPTVFARGFGGFHGGGGMGGGGFGGGGFQGGGFGGGGFAGGGGFHPEGFGGGGMAAYHPQGYGGGMGGYHPQNFGGGMGMGMASYGGGYHPPVTAGNGMSDFHDYGGVASGGVVGGLPASLGGFRAGSLSGYNPGELATGGGELLAGSLRSGELGSGAYHGEASVPMDSQERGLVDSINRNGLKNFGSLPTDGGMPAAKTAVDDHPAAAVAAHPAAAEAAAHPTATAARFSPTYDHAQALTAQRWFDDHPAFTPAWIASHAWAWYPYESNNEAWANAFWDAVSWAAVDGWLDNTNAPPQNYDYGDNIVYQNDNVLVNSQPVGTPQQFYQQAEALAVTDAHPKTSTGQGDAKKQWLPLGVFGLMRADAQKPDMIFQLALDKQGTIRGNYYSEVSDKTQPVYGSVDEKTQRAAWTVGDNKKVIIETGLYNLTKDETTALVHLGPDQEQRYVLVRLKQSQSLAQNKK